MSELTGNKLSDHLHELLNGENLEEKLWNAILIVTNGPEGWPHPAMLSYGEVVAIDPGTLRLVTWEGTTTTGNLKRNPNVTLILVDREGAYYIKGRAEPLGKISERISELGDKRVSMSVFQMGITRVLEDVNRLTPLITGITYRFRGDEQVYLKERVSILAKVRELGG
ncbi:MAG: pyridoxamine 5'-phosphate oxidase family protein [Candidatus Bipolaricaulia bacterium]